MRKKEERGVRRGKNGGTETEKILPGKKRPHKSLDVVLERGGGGKGKGNRQETELYNLPIGENRLCRGKLYNRFTRKKETDQKTLRGKRFIRRQEAREKEGDERTVTKKHS